MDISVGFRNPVEFVNQWYTKSRRRRACFIWMLWAWKSSFCGAWTDWGVRILGVEISIRQWGR